MTINSKKIDEDSTTYSPKLDKSDRLQHRESGDNNSAKSSASNFEDVNSHQNHPIAHQTRNVNAASSDQQAQPISKHARPRRRKTIAEIYVPEHQINMSALRFSIKSLDIFAVGIIIVSGIWNSYIGGNNNFVIALIAAAVLGTTIFTVILFASQAYRFSPTETLYDHLKTVTLAALAALGSWLTFALITRPDTFLPDMLARTGLYATTGLILLHIAYHQYIKRLHMRRALAPTIVMLGATESARRLIEENARTKELNILAIFDDRLERAPLNIHGVPIIGKLEDLMAWDSLPYINRIVVTLPALANARKKEFVKRVRLLPNRIAFVVDEFETLNHVQQRLTEIAEVSMMDITGDSTTARYAAVKRATDIFISLIALIIGAPFLALIALLIRLDSPGAVIFKQPRHGFNNRSFDVYKFRSMRIEESDMQAAKQTQAGDSRITKIGRFIRKTSIDELPQLLNVLKGDMSLVGPRPHAIGMRTGDTESYRLVEEYAHRHRVKPGMTGWAQIHGSRGPLHNAADVAERVRLDIEYIERSNWTLDIYIMLKTLPVMLGDRQNIR